MCPSDSDAVEKHPTFYKLCISRDLSSFGAFFCEANTFNLTFGAHYTSLSPCAAAESASLPIPQNTITSNELIRSEGCEKGQHFLDTALHSGEIGSAGNTCNPGGAVPHLKQGDGWEWRTGSCNSCQVSGSRGRVWCINWIGKLIPGLWPVFSDPSCWEAVIALGEGWTVSWMSWVLLIIISAGAVTRSQHLSSLMLMCYLRCHCLKVRYALCN